MTRLVITARDGRQTTVEHGSGHSAMEAIRAAGVDELLAICGGVCACGTCHVYVDPQFAEIITPMGPDESELLSALTHRRPNSRLACQIRLEAPLVELKVQVAPED